MIEITKIACNNIDYKDFEHFVGADKMFKIWSKTTRKLTDYKLSRYVYYLIAQNGDSRKSVIALTQTYFAV